MNGEPEELLTVNELAEKMHCSTKFAYQLMKHPSFPSIHINRRVFVPISAYNQWAKINAGKSITL